MFAKWAANQYLTAAFCLFLQRRGPVQHHSDRRRPVSAFWAITSRQGCSMKIVRQILGLLSGRCLPQLLEPVHNCLQFRLPPAANGYGASLHAFMWEPEANPALLEVANVVVALHIASASVDTRREMSMLAARNAVAALGGRRPPTLLNPEVWDSASGQRGS